MSHDTYKGENTDSAEVYALRHTCQYPQGATVCGAWAPYRTDRCPEHTGK